MQHAENMHFYFYECRKWIKVGGHEGLLLCMRSCVFVQLALGLQNSNNKSPSAMSPVGYRSNCRLTEDRNQVT